MKSDDSFASSSVGVELKAKYDYIVPHLEGTSVACIVVNGDHHAREVAPVLSIMEDLYKVSTVLRRRILPETDRLVAYRQ